MGAREGESAKLGGLRSSRKEEGRAILAIERLPKKHGTEKGGGQHILNYTVCLTGRVPTHKSRWTTTAEAE